MFKIERGSAGEKIAYVRLFSGTVRVRERLHFGRDNEARVTAVRVFDRGSAVRRASVAAGQIGKIWGLGDVQIGDAIGLSPTTVERRSFAPPTLETIIVPRRPADRGALHVALAQLAEQDPLINLRQDDIRQELFLSLYGEVQKEVIRRRWRPTSALTSTSAKRPRSASSGRSALARTARYSARRLTHSLPPSGCASSRRRSTLAWASGWRSSLDRFRSRSIRPSRIPCEPRCSRGIYGWQVTDCTVTMTHSGYSSVASTAGDFRNLTPLVLMSALKQAETIVCEPMHRFQLEIPADTFGRIVPVLAQLRALPQTPVLRASSYLLEGEIPAAHVHELQQQLPALTRGEGVLESAFDYYKPIRGTDPDAGALGRQPAQPQGVPAACCAAGLANRDCYSAPRSTTGSSIW